MKIVLSNDKEMTVYDSILGFARIINLITGEAVDNNDPAFIACVVTHGESVVAPCHAI